MNAKGSVLVIVLALVLLFSMVSMATASQTWYMLNTASGATGAEYEMHKGSGTGDDYVAIAASGSNIWAADQKVAVSKIDMSGDWTGNIHVYIYPVTSGGSLKVEIGVCNTGGGGSFTVAPAGTTSVTESWTSGDMKDMKLAALWPSEFDLAQDEYLALRLTNMGASELRIRTASLPTSKSYLTFEGDDPVYPVPELSALLLTSIGVLMLGGFIVYSRRRDKE